MGNEPVVVKDAKTGEDLTRSILLQIILEEEAGGAPMFSETMLANIIRFYGHAMQGFMGSTSKRTCRCSPTSRTSWPSRPGHLARGLEPVHACSRPPCRT
jgi:hypothetical protein